MKVAELHGAKQLRSTEDRVRRAVARTSRRATQPLAPAAPAAPAPVRPAKEGTIASIKKIQKAANVVQVGVAFRKGFATAQNEGKDIGASLMAGAKDALVPALTAAAPTIATIASHGARKASDLTVKVARNMAHAKSEHVKAVLASGVVITGSSQVLLSTAKLAAKFASPINAAWGGYKGAQSDSENRLRGAARGAITSFDPTAAFMERGVVERGFDRLFGQAPKVLKEAGAKQRKLASDNTFERTYHKGPKAGTTEIVRRT